MPVHGSLGPNDDASRAVERVLQAERDAEQRLVQVRQQAQALLDATRDDALAIVNRAGKRIARWQQGHAAALERRLQRLRARDSAGSHATQGPDAQQVAAAVERLARLLTGDSDGRSA
mgnify:FL=1